MKTDFFLLFFAVIAGGALPIQAGLNSKLTTYLGHPIQASFISFMGGVVFMVILMIIMRPEFPGIERLTETPPYLFLGGFMGGIFVTTIIILVPKIGVTPVLAGTLTGQFLVSLIIDHYGILGVPVQHISLSRIAGITLMFAGLFFVQKG
ncbi:DMT family transporter [Limisalsivibrio acetivorans]|uniref:DMT family transporter n=1 Tax=Limisalsivibrio acetivorans TaxID=1304888 RepID=UPI0003B3C8BD|nr:DMT family transporter [Limisalsivibrio acetivorans]